MTTPGGGDNVANMIGAMQPMLVIAETVVGYRKTLVDGGVGADTADELAAEFHKKLLEIIAASMASQFTGRRR